MANRPFSRGAQPLSKHQSAFAGDREFFRFGYPDTSSEARVPKNRRVFPQLLALGQSQIFVLSKSTLPPGALYAYANRYNLISHAEGQSALNSCLA